MAPSSPPAPADDAPVPTQDGEHAGVTAKNEGIALDGASLGESNSLSVSGGTASDGRGAGGPAGSGHGASIGGGPGAGAAGGGRGAIGQMDYGALEAHLRSRAARCYPRAAERRSIEGVVSLAFCIDEAGGPAAIRLVRRSGSELLDQAAIECVLKGAAPLPAPAGCISSLPIRFSLP
ncbi:energy transducer TonB [Vulgatibacter incomptus]|nr:energy transducer TonB [Vulgatibacter incomptus]